MAPSPKRSLAHADAAGRPLPVAVHRHEREAVESADLVVTHSALVAWIYARLFPGQVGKLHPVIAWDVPGLGPDDRAGRAAPEPGDWHRRDIDWIAVASSWARPEKNLPLLARLVEARAGRRVHVVGEQATEVVHIGLMAMLQDGGAELFNRACFNYPTLGDLYKYATYDALLQRRGHPVDPMLV